RMHVPVSANSRYCRSWFSKILSVNDDGARGVKSKWRVNNCDVRERDRMLDSAVSDGRIERSKVRNERILRVDGLLERVLNCVNTLCIDRKPCPVSKFDSASLYLYH